MKRDFYFSPISRFFAGLVLFLMVFSPVAAQEDPLSVNGEYIVNKNAEGKPEEYSRVTINQNSHLIVEGILIVHGDLEMEANETQVTFRDGSVVIVYGDVKAGNKVSVSAHSHFIVYGNFERKQGNTEHSEADFTNGNVYIFGEVDDTWEIDDCDKGNDGDTKDDGSCEYRTEEDFWEDELDPDLQEALNCYKIQDIENVAACENQTANFEVEFIDEIPVTIAYQWQKRLEGGVWENIKGETGSTLTVEAIDLSMDGTNYRLVLSGGSCKMSISNTATLTVAEPVVIGEITGPAEVCGNGPIVYTLPGAQSSGNYSWEVPSGWTFESITNSEISITPGTVSGEIKVTGPASCGTTIERVLWVEVKLPGMWNGSVSSLWEDPENWDCNTVPTPLINVIIPLDTDVYPVINKEVIATSNDIQIEDGASLEVLGDLQISGSISAKGNLNAMSGTLSFTGILAQTIPENSLSGNRVANLNVDNPAGVSVKSTLEITEILTVQEGNFHTNAHLTLISDENGTALVSGSGTGNIVGAVTLQRYLDPAYGYKYFSSPLKGTTVGDFGSFMDLKHTTTNFPHFYRYEESRIDSVGSDLSGWEAYTDPLKPINVLEGYGLNFGTGGAKTIALSGEVNNGPQSKVLSNSQGTYTRGFHLIGNPYPSPIDWDSSDAWTRDNIDDAIYFFNASTTDPYTGTYTSYVTNGLSTDGNVTSIIPSMQGFFVHVSEGASQGTLGISNEARVSHPQEFHKSSRKEKLSFLRLSAGFEGEAGKDPTVIYFNSSAANSFDKHLDAYKLMNTNQRVPSFYSLTPKTEELSINALPSFPVQDLERIPMGIKVLKAGNLRILLEDLENLPSGNHVYLVDLEKKTFADLLREKTYSTYISQGIYNKRFEIVVSREPILEAERLLKLPMSVYGTKEKISIQLYLETEAPAEITVSTLSGQILKTMTTSQEQVEIEGIKSAGIYIIHLRSGDTQYSKKILIN